MIDFGGVITAWYSRNKRDLPWRNTTDAYTIWLSEIILQQTRVNQGLPYFERFIEKYPNVEDLACAPEDEVLRLWQGLGYYSRARNLHSTAQWVANNCNKNFPSSYEDLIKLKGIGDYTAAAIASFSSNERIPVLDGNVFRVLSRVFGLEEDIAQSSSRKIFLELLNQLIENQNPKIFNQAIMEFGALQCTPKSPNCEICPFVSQCFAFHEKRIGDLPLKSKKAKKKNKYFNYVILKFGEKIHLTKRSDKEIWGGLYEFLLLEGEDLYTIDDILKNIQPLKNSKIFHFPPNTAHQLSHLQIFSQMTLMETDEQIEGLQYYSKDEVENLPKHVLIDKFLRNHTGIFD